MISSGRFSISITLVLIPAMMDSVLVYAARKKFASLKSLSLSRRSIQDDIFIMLRGGQSQDPHEQPLYYSSGGGGIPHEGYRNPEDGFANYNPPKLRENKFDQDVNLFKESVQERTDKWRSAQMERYANLTPEQECNPRDEEGRMKLMSSVSKGSRAVIFFVLLWRDIYLFEVTDQSVKGSLRKTIIRFILTTVFIGNLAGVVTSVTSPAGHVANKRLKAILNLDKVVETGLLLWNFLRVTLFPSKYVPREIFIAGTLHSIFFILQCQFFTRVTWDEKVAPMQSSQKQQQQESPGYQQTSNDYRQTLVK